MTLAKHAAGSGAAAAAPLAGQTAARTHGLLPQADKIPALGALLDVGDMALARHRVIEQAVPDHLNDHHRAVGGRCGLDLQGRAAFNGLGVTGDEGLVLEVRLEDSAYVTAPPELPGDTARSDLAKGLPGVTAGVSDGT